MQRSLISLAVLAVTSLSAPALAGAAPAAAPAAAQVTTQLPRNAIPTHYAVSLTPDAAKGSFSASVTIALKVVKPTDTLTLNAADLVFSAATLSAGPGQPLLPATISVDAAHESASFHFDKTLAPGSYQFKLVYTGVIGTQPTGLFSLDYEGVNGKQRALYTQFENSDARRMIPSWDEPDYKATFALEVTAPAGLMAVSNMPVASTSTMADGRQLVRFATTPKMSTYLLFFGLGDFERASATEGATELGVVVQRGSLSQAQFALDSSRAVLREYNDYFGVKYPLPKLDNVAAPGRSQFFGAMENWGAIFSFEYAMLLDPRTATQANRETTFQVAAHEMAHQWFGDLVTMRWWDDLWLNEGFASWMEARTTNRLHPEWHLNLQAVATREYAMANDAMASTHPVVQHIATVEQASQAFDAITYQKGASVIHMLENYVGDDAWRSGVRSYMARHAYGNTVSDDLWREVEKAAHKPVTAIAHDFTLQPGVPLLRVSDPVCRNGKSSVTLTQGEFSKDQPNKRPLSWRVPVIAQTVGGASVRAVVSGKPTSMTLPGCGAVLVNAGQSGYYRTLYAPKAFAALAANFAGIDTIDQLGVLGDSWALGMAGLQPAYGMLDLARGVKADAAPQVWEKIAGVLTELHAAYANQPAEQAQLDSFGRARLAPVLARIGWDGAAGEAAPVVKLRELLIKSLGTLGDAPTIAEARRRHAAAASDPAALSAALRRPVLAVVAEHADGATWDQLHAAALAEKSDMVKGELYDLLGSSADRALAQRALALALSSEPSATRGAAIISRVAQRHPDLAFDFALAHRAEIEKKIDSTSASRYFPQLGSGSADPAMVDKLRAYAQAYLPVESHGAVNKAVAAVQYRVTVQASRLPEISGWLAQQAK